MQVGNKLLKLDQEFAVIEPDFHDGTITGISVQGSQPVVLTCKEGEDGNVYRIHLPNVTAVVIDGFRLGNIIFNVYLYAGAACPREILAKATDLSCPEDASRVDEIMTRFRTENWTLLHIDCMDGGQVFVVAKSTVDQVQIELVDIQRPVT
jgi:hypothetical protein